MAVVKGMVQVAERTYRIVRLEPGVYEAVRLLDDVAVGSFRTAPEAQIHEYCIERSLMQRIARAAIHAGRTSFVGKLSDAPSEKRWPVRFKLSLALGR